MDTPSNDKDTLFNEEQPEPKSKKRVAKKRRRGSGEGTVYQRQDGRWVAELTLEDGERAYLYAKKQEEVIVKLQQAQYELRQGTLARGPKQKLADHLNWWFEEVQRQKIREGSYIRYRNLLDKHILPALGHLQLQKVTTHQIQTFYNRKLKEKQSSSSVHSMHKILHKALDYAKKAHIISYNPSENISLPKQAKRKIQPLTLEQAQHLLKVAKGSSLEVFVTLALTTGMRHGELLALRWSDIDFDKESIYVHRTVAYYGKSRIVEGEPKTEAGERMIPVSVNVCTILRSHKVHQSECRLKIGGQWNDHDLVLCNKTGGFLLALNVRVQFYKLLDRAGLPRMHVHDLRHVASTLFRSLGVDLKVIQEILGHSSMDMTANVYSYVLPSMQKEAAEKINSLFL